MLGFKMLVKQILWISSCFIYTRFQWKWFDLYYNVNWASWFVFLDTEGSSSWLATIWRWDFGGMNAIYKKFSWAGSGLFCWNFLLVTIKCIIKVHCYSRLYSSSAVKQQYINSYIGSCPQYNWPLSIFDWNTIGLHASLRAFCQQWVHL